MATPLHSTAWLVLARPASLQLPSPSHFTEDSHFDNFNIFVFILISDNWEILREGPIWKANSCRVWCKVPDKRKPDCDKPEKTNNLGHWYRRTGRQLSPSLRLSKQIRGSETGSVSKGNYFNFRPQFMLVKNTGKTNIFLMHLLWPQSCKKSLLTS